MRWTIALMLLVSCTDESKPQLTVTPDRLDLGRLIAGESVDARLSIRSTGDAPLLIDAVVPSEDALMFDAPVGIELPAGGSMELSLRYLALEAGPIDARLSIASAAGVVEVPVSGIVESLEDPPDAGEPSPDAAVTPDAGERDAGEIRDAGEPVDGGEAPTPCVPIFDDPRPLSGTSTNAGYEEGAVVATDGDGVWLSVFASDDDLGGRIGGDLDLFFSRSTDDGATWSYAAPVRLDFAENDSEIDEYPSIAYGGNGAWVVTWQADFDAQTDPARIYAAVSLDDGASFSAPVELATEQDDAIPTVASDGVNWIVAWHAHDTLAANGTDGDINFVRSSDLGQSWSPLGAINDRADVDAGWDGSVVLAALGPGSFIAAWTTDDDGPGYGPDDDVLVSRSFDGGETWEAARPLLDDPTESNAEHQSAIAADRSGRIVVAWPVADQPETLMIATSTDGGEGWITQPAATGAPDDADVAVATDGLGTFLVTWHSHVSIAGNGTDGDILGVISRDGGLTWDETILLNSNAGFDAADDWDPHVASDGRRWQLVYQANAPRDLLFTAGAVCE